MPFELLSRTRNGETRIALLSQGKLVEYYREPAQSASVVGNLYVGQVECVLKDVGAAFVKIGLEKNGFLPLREQESFCNEANGGALKTGQAVLVQVKKDPRGDKGAFLTRDIVLPGQYLLLMPNNRYYGVSRRVDQPQEAARARSLGQDLAQNRFGVVVRHAALSARREDVQREADELWERWLHIKQSAQSARPPALAYREPGMLEVLTRDYAARHELAVFSDDAQALPGQAVTPQEMDERWRACGVERQLSAALERVVPVPGGGTLVIDEREALTTIDVNSGVCVTAAPGESLALAENLRAVGEAARQIRLRNLSGVILVDFIDMGSDAEREQVQAALSQALADDRVKSVLHGFTRLGLMEMTRKRTRDSLLFTCTKPCAACAQTGRVRVD